MPPTPIQPDPLGAALADVRFALAEAERHAPDARHVASAFALVRGSLDLLDGAFALDDLVAEVRGQRLHSVD